MVVHRQQPGVMMWNAGIIYFAEQFTAETTKPVINTIIEKNLMPLTVKAQMKLH